MLAHLKSVKGGPQKVFQKMLESWHHFYYYYSLDFTSLSFSSSASSSSVSSTFSNRSMFFLVDNKCVWQLWNAKFIQQSRQNSCIITNDDEDDVSHDDHSHDGHCDDAAADDDFSLTEKKLYTILIEINSSFLKFHLFLEFWWINILNIMILVKIMLQGKW